MEVSMQALIMRAHVLKTMATRQQTSMFTQLFERGIGNASQRFWILPLKNLRHSSIVASLVWTRPITASASCARRSRSTKQSFDSATVDDDDIVVALGIDELL